MASSSLNDVNKALPVPIAGEGNFETLSGYLLHKMGRIPDEGEELDLPPYRFYILEKAESSLGLLELELITAPDSATTGKP
jgi:CBS domain containing-hemolysin-like protein